MFSDIINYQKDNVYKSFCLDDSFPDTLYTVGMIDDVRNDLTLKWNETIGYMLKHFSLNVMKPMINWRNWTKI